jgi:phage gp36-like protein
MIRRMNHHHRKTLHALFAHPLSANVDFKKVVHLLEDLGAEVDKKLGNRVGVMLHGRSAALTHAHRGSAKGGSPPSAEVSGNLWHHAGQVS